MHQIVEAMGGRHPQSLSDQFVVPRIRLAGAISNGATGSDGWRVLCLTTATWKVSMIINGSKRYAAKCSCQALRRTPTAEGQRTAFNGQPFAAGETGRDDSTAGTR